MVKIAPALNLIAVGTSSTNVPLLYSLRVADVGGLVIEVYELFMFDVL